MIVVTGVRPAAAVPIRSYERFTVQNLADVPENIRVGLVNIGPGVYLHGYLTIRIIVLSEG